VKRPPRDHLRAVLRIARWEVERSAGVVDRRTAAVGLLAVLLAGGVVAAGAAAGGGAAIDRDIYRVGVAPDSPYREPVERSVALDARPAEPEAFRDGDVEVLVRDGRVLAANSPKARAAAAEFRSAVRAHNVGLMRAEENGSAAFPVVVVVEYASRSAALPDAVTAATARSAGRAAPTAAVAPARPAATPRPATGRVPGPAGRRARSAFRRWRGSTR
jgi:predicted nucleic acid-binding protein